jgi:carboxypeptidase Q
MEKMPVKMLRLFPCGLSGRGVLLHAADKPKTRDRSPAVTDPYAEVQPATETLDLNMYQRIRDEGLNHSHVMEFATALMDGIGPRLTGLAQPGEGQRVDPRHADQDRPGERAP